MESELLSLYNSHFDKLVRFTFRLTKDREKAEDIVQEVFTNFLERNSISNAKSGKIAYLQKSCFNCWRNQERKLDKLDFSELKILKKLVYSHDYDLMISALDMYQKIPELPGEQRKTIEMFLSGLTIKEISVKQEKPYDTSKANLVHAINKLRSFLVRVN